MLGNVIIGALSVYTPAVIECMYCVHDSRFDLSSCPRLSSTGVDLVLLAERVVLVWKGTV